MVAGYYERAAMRVKMLQDAPGSPDGVTVIQYVKDAVHDLGEDLAGAFVRQGLAEKVETEPAPDPDPAPEPEPDPVPDPTVDPEPAQVDKPKQVAGPAENKSA